LENENNQPKLKKRNQLETLMETLKLQVRILSKFENLAYENNLIGDPMIFKGI
jgi:hypothetical protein